MANPTTPSRLLEAGTSLFSPAEIQVVVVPVGDIPPETLAQYCRLVTRHRQVELQLLRSFYKEQQKSPFMFFPWKNGFMHFRFLTEEAAAQKSALTPLHTYRKVLGIIGICHGPAMADIGTAYRQFEARCRTYSDAITQRCFFFEPSDAVVKEDKSDKPHLMMFPPTESGGLDQLASHAEVVMLDFAASMLAELERFMLTAGPAMIDLNTFCDTSDKLMSSVSVVEEVQRRLYTDEEMMRKRRYCRVQKAMGDVSLLAGSPADAAEHYLTAVDLARTCSDTAWHGAALAGLASAKIVESCIKSGAMRSVTSSSGMEAQARHPAVARVQAEDAGSAGSRGSSGFGGPEFWASLRQVVGLEAEARALLADARAVLKRRSVLPLMVEQDLAWARFIIGLRGTKARREVSDLISGVVELGAGLQFTEDKLTNIMEAAQVMGMVGSLRKRVLLLWQAVEFSRSSERPNVATLQIARKALEPPDLYDEDGEEELLPARRPLSAGLLHHWSVVRCGCIEGVLATAILAGQHADVWDAASLLLREHCRDLPPSRQQALQRTLEAAANQMTAAEKRRGGPGPPPLLSLVRPLPASEALLPRRVEVKASDTVGLAEGSLAGSLSPFIYNAFKAVTGKDRPSVPAGEDGSISWVCGEVATVEVEIRNPTVIPIKVERLTLEVEWAGHPSMAPRDQMASQQAVWKPNPVAMWLPPETPATKVLLTGIPLTVGMFTVVGCHVTALGVSWRQPWTPRHVFLAESAWPKEHASTKEPGGQAQARVSVVDPLPLVEARIEVAPSCVTRSGDRAEAAPPQKESKSAASIKSKGGPSVTLTEAMALKGQVLSWCIGIANIGKLPVVAAVIGDDQQDGQSQGGQQRTLTGNMKSAEMPSLSTGAANRAHVVRMKMAADEATLQASVPLLPQKARIKVPLLLYASQVASYTGDEEGHVDVRLEYAASVDEASHDAIGRRITLPIHFRFLPCLQVVSVAFHEHDVAAQSPKDQENKSPSLRRSSSLGDLSSASKRMRSKASAQPAESASLREDATEARTAAYTDAGVSRCCVMEVDAINCSDVVLQVWLGRRVTPAPASPAWEAVADSPRPWAARTADGHAPLNAHCKLVPARQRVTVSCLVDCSTATSYGLRSSRWPGAAAAMDSSQPHAVDIVAQELCDCFSLYWRHEDLHDAAMPMEIGVLPLPQDLVSQGLDARALTLLCPPPLGSPLSVSFHPCEREPGGEMAPCKMQEILAAGDKVSDAWVSRGSLWGPSVLAGSPLHVLVQASNSTNIRQAFHFSVSCHDGSHLRGRFEGAFDTSSAMAAGHVSGLEFSVDQGGRASSSFIVTFFHPGVYCLSAVDMQARPADQAPHETAPGNVAVYPLYILVNA
ncbi:probable trafficking protein particle complex subunit 9 at N-terminal half [Coccomyxa sp. Obi]|nr:probable trafficking protein particle complex subunit 9 at N-terminal half [Coccomyxa sp. Obi]